MKDSLLLLLLIVFFVIGRHLMGRLDRFLHTNARREEEDAPHTDGKSSR